MFTLLIQLTVFLAGVGLLWWLLATVLPAPPAVKQIITVVLSVICVAVTIATLFDAFGLAHFNGLGLLR